MKNNMVQDNVGDTGPQLAPVRFENSLEEHWPAEKGGLMEPGTATQIHAQKLPAGADAGAGGTAISLK